MLTKSPEAMVTIGCMQIKCWVLREYQADLRRAIRLFGTDPRIALPDGAGPQVRLTRDHLANLAALLAGSITREDEE